MVDRTRVRLPEGAREGTIAAAAMIAQQVAGKSARDALYLSSFDVDTLPAMMAASALITLVAVLWLSRMMVRHSPARVVPVAFAASGAAFVAEWGLSFPSPALAAIVLYLHTALFGAVIISAFWSLISETFPPHIGRESVSWIAGGGTIGGALGALATWAASGVIAVATMLPLLAVVNLACLWGVMRLRRLGEKSDPAPTVDPDAPALAPLGVLRDQPYLRDLALVVTLGAVMSGLLDYVFSAEAVAHYRSGPDLLAFFAAFWFVIGVFSFVLQIAFSRIALEKLGIAVTVGLLPGVAVLGGALALLVPGLATTAILRGGEATQRNTLFRAAYEQLYTPLSEQTKRSTKMLIDVGFDRFGTVTAAAIVALAVYFEPPGGAQVILLVLTMVCALISVARSRALRRGYLSLLEDSLKEAAPELEPVSATPAPQQKIEVRDQLVEQLDELRSASAVVASLESLGALVQPVIDLCSGDTPRVRGVLRGEAPLPAPLVGFAIRLLADKAVHLDAIAALQRTAPRATGQLVDALCDPSVGFHIRRRIPRVLGECRTQHAADALLRGLDDERFEVRYACGRALLGIAPDPAIEIGLERVIAIVKEELKRAKGVWEKDDDDEDEKAASLFDRLANDRMDRSMEHVFNLLALNLDAEALRTAFKALHTDDLQLRGTALEYLETVLPAEVRDLVWPFLGAERPMRAERPAQEILADIVQPDKA